MVTFSVDGNLGKFTIYLPSNLLEITEDYLKKITQEVEVADNYSLVGICYREKISTLILSARQKKKDISTAVIPIFVKAGKTDNEFINSIKPCDKLLISGSNISLGQHVTAPLNEINIERILALTEGDANIYQTTLKLTSPCYFLEFKLIPNCNILGRYNSNSVSTPVESFIIKEK